MGMVLLFMGATINIFAAEAPSASPIAPPIIVPAASPEDALWSAPTTAGATNAAPAKKVAPAPEQPVAPSVIASNTVSPVANATPKTLEVIEQGANRLVFANMDTLDDKHRLVIGDRLSFRIVEDQEEAKPLVVADSGEVELPYIGRFPALDKTSKELAWAIKAELEKEYYYQATVLIAVDLRSKTGGKVYLNGAIAAPGPQEIPTDETFTISKAIMRAGGFGQYADKKKVKLSRKDPSGGGNTISFVVNVAEILDRGRSDKDIVLMPGDLIIVPSRLINF